jgi:hypothetical protein
MVVDDRNFKKIYYVKTYADPSSHGFWEVSSCGDLFVFGKTVVSIACFDQYQYQYLLCIQGKLGTERGKMLQPRHDPYNDCECDKIGML